jgi:hypothetical protein
MRRTLVMTLAGCCSLGCGLAADASGQMWTTPSVVSPPGSFVTEPQLAVDSRGDAVAAWNQQTGLRGDSLVVSVRAAGASVWSAPQQLYGLKDEGTTFDPQLAVAPTGAAVLAWQQLSTSGPPTIAAVCRGSAGGPWSDSKVVARGYLTTSAELGIDARGTATLVFLDGTGRGQTVDVSSLDACGGDPRWSAPVVVGRTSSEVAEPGVAVSPAGESVAVWSASRRQPRALGPGVGGAYRFDSWVEASVRLPGENRWRRPVRLGRETQLLYDADFTASASGPQVAVDASGAAIAVWEHNPTRHRLVGEIATFSPHALAWRPHAIATPGEAISPRVASSPSGWATLAWETGSSSIATRSGPISGCCWTATTNLAGSRSSYDDDLALVAGPRHGAAIGYSQNDQAVRVAVHPQADGGWVRPIPLGLGPGHGLTDPVMQALAVGVGGQLLAAWTQESPSTTPNRLDAPLYTATTSEP